MLFNRLQVKADEQGNVQWEIHFVDSTIVRAHQDAAGAKKGHQALGYSRGGFSTKINVRCEPDGKPMTFVLTPGQRHDTIGFVPLMEQGEVNRAGPGRPKQKPDRVVGDRGYSYKDNRAYLRRRGIRHTIPRRPDHQRRGPFNKTYYKMRNRVERLINRLKQFRRIATRYEKLAENYLAMLHIGSILLWL
jgi:transposase